MENNLVNQIFTVLTAIVGVAIIAVIVSNKANTSGVIGAAGNSFATALEAAVSPITGQIPNSGGLSEFGASTPFIG